MDNNYVQKSRKRSRGSRIHKWRLFPKAETVRPERKTCPYLEYWWAAGNSYRAPSLEVDNTEKWRQKTNQTGRLANWLQWRVRPISEHKYEQSTLPSRGPDKSDDNQLHDYLRSSQWSTFEPSCGLRRAWTREKKLRASDRVACYQQRAQLSWKRLVR